MTPEKNDKKLTRWLLAATIALLALVLCLQLWQMFGRKTGNGALVSDSANGPAAPQAAEPLTPPAAGVSQGKTTIIEDVQALNPALSSDDLASLSSKELEQLWKTGAPGLPIGMSLAAHAAEQYAGTLEVDSVTSKTEPELDEAPAHYEVELRHPTLGNFEYKIDAYTGEVLEGLPDIMGSVPSAAPQEAPAPEAKPPAQAQTPSAQKPAAGDQAPAATGEEAAKSAAFTHAGVSAADAEAVRCKLDGENGRQVYDIEFWVGNTEYDYEIDASTNAVLESKQEQNSRPGGTAAQQPGSFIGEEAAKSAALSHAGISAADAGYVQCELDEDDGRWIYELEFRAGSVEYEYEIDASSGTVVKAAQDR